MKYILWIAALLIFGIGIVKADSGITQADSLRIHSRVAALQEAYQLKAEIEIDQETLKRSPCRVKDSENGSGSGSWVDNSTPECDGTRDRVAHAKIRVVQILGPIYQERFSTYAARVKEIASGDYSTNFSENDRITRMMELESIQEGLDQLSGAVRADQIQAVVHGLDHRYFMNLINAAKALEERFRPVGEVRKPVVARPPRPRP